MAVKKQDRQGIKRCGIDRKIKLISGCFKDGDLERLFGFNLSGNINYLTVTEMCL